MSPYITYLPKQGLPGVLNLAGSENLVVVIAGVILKNKFQSNVKDISISSIFLCLCPLNLSFKLNFNISKAANFRII